MANQLQKHYDILPEVLEFVFAATPNIENSVIEVMYESIQELADEVLSVIDDSSPTLVREDRVYDFHGSRVGVNQSADLTPNEYKVFIRELLLCLNEGPTAASVERHFKVMFPDATLLELFVITDQPALRKIFRVSFDLKNRLFFSTSAIALTFARLFLEIVKTETSHFELVVLQTDEIIVGPSDSLQSLVVEFLARGPALIDQVFGVDGGVSEANYEKTLYAGDSVFHKNNFTNRAARKNNLGVPYLSTWGADRDHDSVTIVGPF